MIGTDQTGMTLGQLTLELAKRFGLARIVSDAGEDIAPTLPTEASRLATLRTAVNDAYRRFVAAHPKWTFLRVSLDVTLTTDGSGSLNVGSDARRYYLPKGITSRPSKAWTLVSPDGQTIGYVIDTSAQRVATTWATQPDAGVPQLAAMRPVAGDADGRWELIVAPIPDDTYTLSTTVRLTPPELAADTDRHCAGAQHDQTLILMACDSLAREDMDPSRRSRYSKDAAEALMASVTLDAELVEDEVQPPIDTPNLDTSLPLTRAGVRRGRELPVVTYGD